MSRKIIFRFATVVLALIPFFAATVFAQSKRPPVGDGSATAVDPNNLVVKISTPDETGAGIIVGTRDSDTFIVTAYHVVKDAQKIGVTVFAKKYADVPAEFIRFNELLDVAVIKISTSADTSLLRLPAIQWREGVRLNERVTVVGHPADLEWLSEAQQVAKLDYQADPRKFLYSSPTLQRGVSGGPVFDENGALLGMATARGPAGYAIAVTSGSLIKLLKDEWGIPTSYLNAGVDRSGSGTRPTQPASSDTGVRESPPLPTLVQRSFVLPRDGVQTSPRDSQLNPGFCCRVFTIWSSNRVQLGHVSVLDATKSDVGPDNVVVSLYEIELWASTDLSTSRSRFVSQLVSFGPTDPVGTEKSVDLGRLHFLIRLLAAQTHEGRRRGETLLQLNSVQIQVDVSPIPIRQP